MSEQRVYLYFVFQEMDRARGMMEKHLQMPPYMKEREKRNEVLANDPDIAPVLTSKYVFMDISERENEAGVRTCMFSKQECSLDLPDLHCDLFKGQTN